MRRVTYSIAALLGLLALAACDEGTTGDTGDAAPPPDAGQVAPVEPPAAQ